MKINPITIASRAKGPFALYGRAQKIATRYGLTSAPMDQALQQFANILRQFGCSASFPITAVALERNRDMIARYLNANIEFVVHGYTHIDCSQFNLEEQLNHLERACKIFSQMGIASAGYRSPYLRRGPYIQTALETAGFSYVSNQPIIWDVIRDQAAVVSNRAAYDRALAFYEPWNANERPSLPWLNHQLVEIPISFPDDEILVDRLGGGTELIEETWLAILSKTYQQGELFTILLHPERIGFCANALASVLTKALTFAPSVWCARMDEIASWWKARARATINVTETAEGGFHCVVDSPTAATLLIRSVEVDTAVHPWDDGYSQIKEKDFTLQSSYRPFIGISSTTTPKLNDWLHQQGYFTEISEDRHRYQCYFDQPEFTAGQERSVLAKIENTYSPLVRLGRWPNGARSAICISGDIDALTLWDYGFRLFGK
jgi:peptidoglycan/xylan/chitin deacetylase (PgdA/CDA1 family)